MEPIVVEVTRGDLVESRHTVHAVAVQGGAVVLEAGDPGLVAFMRSSAKPFQALPVVRARPDLATRRSRSPAPRTSRVRNRSPPSVPARPCARRRRTSSSAAAEPTPLEHNCSGKHAGMLALCRAEGWESGGYRLAGHPVQEACLREVAAAADVDPGTVPTAVDGCGVRHLRAHPRAHGARLRPSAERSTAVTESRARCSAFPDHIRGPLAADSLLMRHATGWTAKGGAEGLLCAAGPDGVGLALKVEDGNTRAARPALREVLRRLGRDVPELAPVAVENSRGERVGELLLEVVKKMFSPVVTAV